MLIELQATREVKTLESKDSEHEKYAWVVLLWYEIKRSSSQKGRVEFCIKELIFNMLSEMFT